MGKSVIALLILPMLFSCEYLSWYPDDNPIEEAVEDIILEKTGVDVDFSGDSKE